MLEGKKLEGKHWQMQMDNGSVHENTILLFSYVCWYSRVGEKMQKHNSNSETSSTANYSC